MAHYIDDFNRVPGTVGTDYNVLPADTWEIDNSAAYHSVAVNQWGSIISTRALATADMVVTGTWIMAANPGAFHTIFARWDDYTIDNGSYYFLDVSDTGETIRVGRYVNPDGVYLADVSGSLGFSTSDTTVDSELRVETIVGGPNDGDVLINAWVAGVHVVDNLIDDDADRILAGVYYAAYSYGEGRLDTLEAEDLTGAAVSAQSTTSAVAAVSVISVPSTVTLGAVVGGGGPGVNKLRIGGVTPGAFKIGSAAVAKLYLGSVLVYDASGSTPIPPSTAVHDLLGFHNAHIATDEFISAAFYDPFTGVNGTAAGGWAIFESNPSQTVVDIQGNEWLFNFTGATTDYAIAIRQMPYTQVQQWSGAWRIIGDSSSSGGNGVWLCADDTGDEPLNGYKLRFGSSTWSITRRVAGVDTTVATTARTPTNALQRGIFEVVPNPANLAQVIVRAKVWLDGVAEPGSWTLTYTDATPLAAGRLEIEAHHDLSGSISFTEMMLTTMPSTARWHAKDFASGLTGVEFEGWANIYVGPEGLEVVAKRTGPSSWSSGWLSGNQTHEFTGERYVEARAKVPAGNGLWSAPIWEWVSPYGTSGVELDVVEQLAWEPTTYHGTVHHSGGNQVSRPFTVGPTLVNQWHIYACAVYNDHVDFYLDDLKVATTTAAQLGAAWELTTTNMVMNANLELGGGGWNSAIDPALNEAHMIVDYIRVWTKPPGGDLALGGKFMIGVDIQPADSVAKWAGRGIDTFVRIPEGANVDAWIAAMNAGGMRSVRAPRMVGASIDPRDNSDASLSAFVLPDEPDLIGNQIPYTTIQAMCDLMEAFNPDKPRMLNVVGFMNQFDVSTGEGGGPAWYRKYFLKVDWLSGDEYPINADHFITEVGTMVDNLEALYPGRPAFAYIECCDIGGTGGPSADQMRAEIWSAIIHGARGIIYFPISFVGGFQFDATPGGNVTEMTATNARVRALETVLQGPIDPAGYTATVSAPLQAGWRFDGTDLYVFVVNTAMTTQTNATVTITGVSSTAVADVLDESRTETLVAGVLTDTWTAGQVHVYKF